jgi:hypothetical protein
VRERSTSCHVKSAFGRQMADRAPQVSASATRARSSGKTSKSGSHLSLAIDEFLDMDFGDISKSLSDLYKKLSLLWGRFWRTRPAEGDAAPSRGLLPGLAPFSTSKLTKTCAFRPRMKSEFLRGIFMGLLSGILMAIVLANIHCPHTTELPTLLSLLTANKLVIKIR